MQTKKELNPPRDPVGVVRGCLKCFREEPQRVRRGMRCPNPKCQGGVIDTFTVDYWNRQMDAELERLDMERNGNTASDTKPSDFSYKVEAFKGDMERLAKIYNLCIEPIPVEGPGGLEAFLVVKDLQHEADLDPIRNC
jgi:hypothetical protein